MSEAGPFGGAATKVADADALKSLIEKTAANHDGEPDDRKTREVDPAQFRALLRQQAEAAPAVAQEAAAPEPPASEPAAPEPPAPEPPAPATFDDGLDSAFADPDAGAEVASPTATSATALAESAHAPEVAVRKSEPRVAITAPPARGRSALRLVIASVTVLALAALGFVLAAALM